MNAPMKKIVKKYGNQISRCAVAVSVIASSCCRGSWYQPKEPEGLQYFVKNQKK